MVLVKNRSTASSFSARRGAGSKTSSCTMKTVIKFVVIPIVLVILVTGGFSSSATDPAEFLKSDLLLGAGQQKAAAVAENMSVLKPPEPVVAKPSSSKSSRLRGEMDANSMLDAQKKMIADIKRDMGYAKRESDAKGEGEQDANSMLEAQNKMIADIKQEMGNDSKQKSEEEDDDDDNKQNSGGLKPEARSGEIEEAETESNKDKKSKEAEASPEDNKSGKEKEQNSGLEQKSKPDMISCGSHQASSCEECVADGKGASSCNGDCVWCGSSCQKTFCWLAPKPEPWFTAEDKRYGGKTLSVVLPCAFEHDFFERTTKSVLAATPADVLKEIIVLDDASQPPLKFEKDPEKTKLIRHSGPPLGLIGAKQMGAEAATGDIIVFLDCHVKPALGWWEPIVREIAENPKRVVVPMITHLDVDTWVESGRPQGNGGLSKCYLTLDGQFKWTNDDKPWVPIMSGGLLAMAKDWFFEIGGHDKGMKGWGGENLDLSLRIWRCGGEIVSATRSYVGHMWRDSKKRNTASKYTVQAGDVHKNIATAMMGHSEEYFLGKTVTFPGFGDFKRSQDGLNLKPIQEPMEKCSSFQWYLDRFAYIYNDAGVLPKEVFQLSPDDGKNCLQITASRPWGNANAPQDKLYLKPCSADKDRSNQWWHGSNRNSKGECCSGMRVWNTDQCMSSSGTFTCDLQGIQPSQQVHVSSSGALMFGDKSCLSATLEVTKDCSTGSWKSLNAFTPIEFELLEEGTKGKWSSYLESNK